MDCYIRAVQQTLDQAIATQRETLEAVAELCAKAMMQERKVFFFGTGHSHLLAEEPFYRAGGLVAVHPILEPSLMLHEGGIKSTRLERVEAYAEILLDEHGVGEGDVLFIISNSGINGVPVEMALGAKRRRATVIALTSLKHTTHATSRHSSGRKLYQVADLCLDNCGVVGDAALAIEGSDLRTGPTSTIVGAFLINCVVVGITRCYVAAGLTPPLYVSANLDEGDEHNRRVMREERMDAAVTEPAR